MNGVFALAWEETLRFDKKLRINEYDVFRATFTCTPSSRTGKAEEAELQKCARRRSIPRVRQRFPIGPPAAEARRAGGRNTRFCVK